MPATVGALKPLPPRCKAGLMVGSLHAISTPEGGNCVALMPAGIGFYICNKRNSYLELTSMVKSGIIIIRKGALNMSIGQRMKELREASHLSQKAIAQLAGSNQATVAKTETGKMAPSVKLLIWWADYFDVSLDYLCCRTDQPQGKLYECKPRMSINSDDFKQFVEMCFDPTSPFNAQLKDTLIQMMEEQK